MTSPDDPYSPRGPPLAPTAERAPKSGWAWDRSTSSHQACNEVARQPEWNHEIKDAIREGGPIEKTMGQFCSSRIAGFGPLRNGRSRTSARQYSTGPEESNDLLSGPCREPGVACPILADPSRPQGL
jgi:hypothetical protein